MMNVFAAHLKSGHGEFTRFGAVPFLCLLLLFLGCLPLHAADNAQVKGLVKSGFSRNAVLSRLANKDDDLRSLCSGLKKCMGMQMDFCTEDDLKPWPKTKYDAEFCEPYQEISRRGFEPDLRKPRVIEVYARLGRQYRAIYENKGTLPMNENEISYLFDNMPFTARLINAYLESNYSLDYNGSRRYFSGSNGGNLSGDFYWALQDSAGAKLGMRNMFFGFGHAKILKWSLHGTAIAYLDMDKVSDRKLAYKLTAIVFPGNSVLNSIMQMRVFKSVVNDKIDEIVNDVKKAAGMYYSGNKEPLLKSGLLKGENAGYVGEFESVVAGAPWKLGDFEKRGKAFKDSLSAKTPEKVIEKKE